MPSKMQEFSSIFQHLSEVQAEVRPYDAIILRSAVCRMSQSRCIAFLAARFNGEIIQFLRSDVREELFAGLPYPKMV
jgi:hypothetical protein